MKEKQAVIQLIKQHLKHHQLINGLEKLGFEDKGFHDLEIFETILKFIPLKDEQLINRFAEMYYKILKEVSHKSIIDPYKELDPLAEKCYRLLDSLLALEELKRNQR